MPETAVNLYDLFASDEGYIGFAGKICTVNPVTWETKRPQEPTHGKLGRGVFAADAPHVVAAAYAHMRLSDGEVQRQV